MNRGRSFSHHAGRAIPSSPLAKLRDPASPRDPVGRVPVPVHGGVQRRHPLHLAPGDRRPDGGNPGAAGTLGLAGRVRRGHARLDGAFLLDAPVAAPRGACRGGSHPRRFVRPSDPAGPRLLPRAAYRRLDEPAVVGRALRRHGHRPGVDAERPHGVRVSPDVRRHVLPECPAGRNGSGSGAPDDREFHVVCAADQTGASRRPGTALGDGELQPGDLHGDPDPEIVRGGTALARSVPEQERTAPEGEPTLGLRP